MRGTGRLQKTTVATGETVGVVDNWPCRLEEFPLHTLHKVEDDQTGGTALL